MNEICGMEKLDSLLIKQALKEVQKIKLNIKEIILK